MSQTIMPDAWYKPTDEALRVIGSERTLRIWRHQGHGPPYYKMGKSRNGRIAYRGQDLLDWIEARRVEVA